MMRILFFLTVLFLAQSLHAEVAKRDVMQHDGRERIHYLYVPPDAGPDTPLVVALHGMGGNAKNLRFGIGLTEMMANLGVAVVYPQGVRLPAGSRHWNAGFDFMDVDDLGYLTELVQRIQNETGVGESKVIFFGISMGAFMAYHMACQSDLPILGIVAVAGTMHPSDVEDCPNRGKTSLLHIHGMQDPLIPFFGGGHWSERDSSPVSVPRIVQDWALSPDTVEVKGVTSSGHVIETRYLNLTRGTEIQLLALPSFGHDWPSEVTANYNAVEDIAAFVDRLCRRSFLAANSEGLF